MVKQQLYDNQTIAQVAQSNQKVQSVLKVFQYLNVFKKSEKKKVETLSHIVELFRHHRYGYT